MSGLWAVAMVARFTREKEHKKPQEANHTLQGTAAGTQNGAAAWPYSLPTKKHAAQPNGPKGLGFHSAKASADAKGPASLGSGRHVLVVPCTQATLHGQYDMAIAGLQKDQCCKVSHLCFICLSIL